MVELITRYSLPLLVLSLTALLITLYQMVGADREAEEAPFLPQRRAALTRAKAARLTIGALVVIVVELAAVWVGARFRPAPLVAAGTATPTAPPTVTAAPSATPFLEPTITLTPTATPPPTSTPTITPTPTVTPVPPTATPLASPTPAFLIYTIEPGDNFSFIAAEFGISIADLEAANPGVNSALLQIGQEIRIPVTGDVPTPTP